MILHLIDVKLINYFIDLKIFNNFLLVILSAKLLCVLKLTPVK